MYDTGIADPSNIVESPDFILDASNLATMRKDDLTPASIGDQVQGWWDASAVQALQFDGSNKELDGMPTKAGDFTFVFDCNTIQDQGSAFLTIS